MFRNDGGNFSNDPYARLLALKLGSMSVDDLNKQENVPQQAITQASNLVGSVGMPKIAAPFAPVAEVAPSEAMGLADKIKAAAQKSNIKWLESPNEAEAAKLKALKDLPKNFFESRRMPEGASSVPEQQARQYQQDLRDLAMKNRNKDQIEAADAQKWENIKKYLFGEEK